MSVSKIYSCDLCGFQPALDPDPGLFSLYFTNAGRQWEPRSATNRESSEVHICKNCVKIIRSAPEFVGLEKKP